MSTKHFIVTDTADYSILGQVRVHSSLFYSNEYFRCQPSISLWLTLRITLF